MAFGPVERLEDEAEDLNKPTNVYAKTAKNITLGFLEGLLAFPTYLNKMDDQPETYVFSGIFGTAINFVTTAGTLFYHEQLIAEHGYTALLPAGALLLTNSFSALREAVKYTRKHENDESN